MDLIFRARDKKIEIKINFRLHAPVTKCNSTDSRKCKPSLLFTGKHLNRRNQSSMQNIKFVYRHRKNKTFIEQCLIDRFIKKSITKSTDVPLCSPAGRIRFDVRSSISRASLVTQHR